MEKKPGWKTTEFWLSVVAAIVGMVMASGAITYEPVVQGMGLVLNGLAALGYGWTRAKTKSSENALEAAALIPKD